MNRNELATFAIKLPHMLRAEQELIAAGLISVPERSSKRMPPEATVGPTVTVYTGPDFTIEPKRRGDFELGPIRKRPDVSDFTIEVRKRPQK